MKILYLTISSIRSYEEKNIYNDLIREIIKQGHSVYSITGDAKDEAFTSSSLGNEILHINIGQVVKAKSLVKKGINMLTLESKYKKAIKKHCCGMEFDLVLYATPPITLLSAVTFAKKKFNTKSYLMLKDIFPQNAVDLGMMKKSGIKGLLYRFFRNKEKKLYNVSDVIGCMSEANIDYILEHNKYIDESKVEMFANAFFEPEQDVVVDRTALREKYNLPLDKLLFVYGGNLGKPQGVDFLAEGIKSVKEIDKVHFLIAGNGSERGKIFSALAECANVTCLEELPAKDYNDLCASCDVGMIMLDKRFTFPNFPSRTLSYLNNAMAIMACTDTATDIKEMIEVADCGKWCHSDKVEDFSNTVKWFVDNEDTLTNLGDNGKKYLIDNFNTTICVDKLTKLVGKEKE